MIVGMSPAWLRIVAGLALGATTVGCATSAGLRREALPYRFGQSMLDGAGSAGRPAGRRKARRRATLAPSRKPAPSTARRRTLARRARDLVGRPFDSDEALLAAALARAVKAADLRRWRKGRSPRLADVVAFGIGERIKLGLVVAHEGQRLTFVHRRGGRARLGWLHLRQPNRRRLPGQRRVANSFVRPRLPDDPPGTRYLAGQLLRGFCPPG